MLLLILWGTRDGCDIGWPGFGDALPYLLMCFCVVLEVVTYLGTQVCFEDRRL